MRDVDCRCKIKYTNENRFVDKFKLATCLLSNVFTGVLIELCLCHVQSPVKCDCSFCVNVFDIAFLSYLQEIKN